MPKLSVIVPIYNVETFLSCCIESILNQTLQDLELILIDDGSPDQCGAICDRYAAIDGRIKVIHQNNHGVSFARNAGLRIASGEYLGFVDPDDFIDADMYNSLITAAECSKCEIAICGFSYCTEDLEILRIESIPHGIFLQRELIVSMYGMPNQFYGSMCNKVFRRTVLEGLGFDETVSIGEDWLLLYECYMRTNKAVAINKCFYTIRVRQESATRKCNAQLYLKKLEAYDKLYQYSFGKDKEIQKKAVDKILDTYLINKNSIIQDDYDKKSLSALNRHMIAIALSSFFRGNLSLKRTVFYIKKGFQY